MNYTDHNRAFVVEDPENAVVADTGSPCRPVGAVEPFRARCLIGACDVEGLFDVVEFSLDAVEWRAWPNSAQVFLSLGRDTKR